MLENFEILDILYEDIEELNKNQSMPSNDTDRKLSIQMRINYLFDLIDRIKQDNPLTKRLLTT